MKWLCNHSLFRFTRNCISFIILLGYLGCSVPQTDESSIHLKWNASYPDETIDDAIIGLKWCLSFLGATDAMQSTWSGLSHQGNTITLEIDSLGFTSEAQKQLKQLHSALKKTEEYQQNQTIDMGRYMALTIGSSYHYYKIAQVPEDLATFHASYTFNPVNGYINNSGVSKVHRIISYAQKMDESRQAYISAEIDTITGEPLEFETVELMPNGLSRFGLYDINGQLKDAADLKITRAGKAAKCMWCHESGIQPLFRLQPDIPGYLTYEHFQDTLTHYGLELRNYQNTMWKDQSLSKRPNHTKMEITYIAFMEPSLQHISNEWGHSESEVKTVLNGLPTHRHEEFDFLGDLYHRKAVDSLAPWKVLEVPESIREKSGNEVNYLD